MRFTPYIFAAIWRMKRRKLHHEKLQQKRLNLGQIMKSRCCLIRSFKNTSLSYRIHCYCARSWCSLLSKRHKNNMKDSSIAAWGTVSSACGLVSAVSYFWLYRFRSRKKQRVNGLYPFLDSLRTVPFFYAFPYKTCAYKGSNFVGTGNHFYPSRSASFDV